MRIIYADNNATTRIAPEVYETMIPFLTEDYFNPSSMYEAARGAAAAIAQARREIASHFGLIDPKQILFTSRTVILLIGMDVLSRCLFVMNGPDGGFTLSM